MSDYTIGIVVEGPTDRIVIEAALATILAGHSYTLIQLQPEASDGFGPGGFGVTGSGWGGVYQWCRQIVSMGGAIPANPSLRRFDGIILHLDADVTEKNYHEANISNPVHHDLPCVKPCPPADDSVQALQQVLAGWLDVSGRLPRVFVVCIPSKCTETWVSVALYGQTDKTLLRNIECNADIENYLAQKPARERLIRNRQGAMKKITRRYAEKSASITIQWENIINHCNQAKIFTEHLLKMVEHNV